MRFWSITEHVLQIEPVLAHIAPAHLQSVLVLPPAFLLILPLFAQILVFAAELRVLVPRVAFGAHVLAPLSAFEVHARALLLVVFLERLREIYSRYLLICQDY